MIVKAGNSYYNWDRIRRVVDLAENVRVPRTGLTEQRHVLMIYEVGEVHAIPLRGDERVEFLAEMRAIRDHEVRFQRDVMSSTREFDLLSLFPQTHGSAAQTTQEFGDEFIEDTRDFSSSSTSSASPPHETEKET